MLSRIKWVLVASFISTSAAAGSTEQVGERLRAFIAAAKFAKMQTQSLIRALPKCSDLPQTTINSDFSPPISFAAPSSTSNILHKLAWPILGFVDTTDGAIGAAVLSVHDGGVVVSVPDADEPIIRDGALLLQKDNAVCAASARISLVPAPPSPSFSIVNIIGRRGPDNSGFTIPYGSDFRSDTGALLVSDCTNGIIQEFSLRGDLLNWFGANGDRPEQFLLPADVKFMNGRIYVVEESNDRVQIFDGEGRFERLIGTPPVGTTHYLFNRPLGVAVSETGEIYVSDYGSGRIKKIDNSGKLKVIAENKPGDPFDLNDPYYVDIDSDRKLLLVTNRGANEIAVLSMDGQKISHFGSGVLNYPHELTTGPRGEIYIADMLNNRIAIFPELSEKDARFLSFPSTWGSPKTVAVNKDGLIAVGFSGGAESFVALLAETEPLKRLGELPVRRFRSGAPERAERSVDSLYASHCMNCHERGLFGAPKRADPTDWEKFPKDLDALLLLTVAGKGAMMARGGCPDCSDSELKALIQHMIPQKWDE